MNSRPRLKASIGSDYTHLRCTVDNPQPDADIYLSCPIFANQINPCYQGCIPTKPCLSPVDRRERQCVPHDQTVFCQRKAFANGTVVISWNIDRTDSRLAGSWSCTHVGQESTRFEVRPSLHGGTQCKCTNEKCTSLIIPHCEWINFDFRFGD